MAILLHELISESARLSPNKIALTCRNNSVTYQELENEVEQCATLISSLATENSDRIGIYLNKNIENVVSILAASLIGTISVPINPVLKPKQVSHIISDCEMKILVTNKARLQLLTSELANSLTLTHIIVIDGDDFSVIPHTKIKIIPWKQCTDFSNNRVQVIVKPDNIAAILYTSGSTGSPKGVMVTHQNLILGAESVAAYLNNCSDDKILAVLPLSFDYGLSQLTTSFLVGAHCVLLDYLLPNDVLKAVDKYQITGIAAVPPLWSQLSKLDWAKYNTSSIRYFTNSGGVLEQNTLQALQQKAPQASAYLMYGLTEAFRSTYLPPHLVDVKKGSIGQAIPNAVIHVINANKEQCKPGEIGELVHSGPLVSKGYWNNKEKTEKRFKPLPPALATGGVKPLAVWSGDFVTLDEDGFLYFISRKDEMIKTSGYRVSPNEVEEVLCCSPDISEVAAIGVQHPDLGQAIITLITTKYEISQTYTDLEKDILKYSMLNMPNYMVPKAVIILSKLPTNANGKIDRSALKKQYSNYFME